MNNLSRNCQIVLRLATEEANRFHHKCIGSEHLFAGILRLPETSHAIRVLIHLGFVPVDVRTVVERHLGELPEGGPLSAKIPHTSNVKQIITETFRQSRRVHTGWLMRSDHMLLALTLEKGNLLQIICEEIGLEACNVKIAILELAETADV